MSETIYTNYWVNRRADIRKEHGSYASEEDAVKGIKSWWSLHGESHETEEVRTNTGALEILYGDPNYFYRIEENEKMDSLPNKSYKLKTKGEIDALRKKYQLGEGAYVFDELAEPYRDRIITAMNSIQRARSYSYTEKGKPIVKIEQYKK